MMPRSDADQAAEDGQRDRLDQELRQDVAAARADRLADADLARPLADRHEHDVHDPDAADDERDRGDAARAAATAAPVIELNVLSSCDWSEIEKSSVPCAVPWRCASAAVISRLGLVDVGLVGRR